MLGGLGIGAGARQPSAAGQPKPASTGSGSLTGRPGPLQQAAHSGSRYRLDDLHRRSRRWRPGRRLCLRWFLRNRLGRPSTLPDQETGLGKRREAPVNKQRMKSEPTSTRRELLAHGAPSIRCRRRGDGRGDSRDEFSCSGRRGCGRQLDGNEICSRFSRASASAAVSTSSAMQGAWKISAHQAISSSRRSLALSRSFKCAGHRMRCSRRHPPQRSWHRGARCRRPHRRSRPAPQCCVLPCRRCGGRC